MIMINMKLQLKSTLKKTCFDFLKALSSQPASQPTVIDSQTPLEDENDRLNSNLSPLVPQEGLILRL